MTTVLVDARLGVRGLGIGTAAERLLEGLTHHPRIEPVIWRGTGGWGAAGMASVLTRSGPFDVAPRLDPRTWRCDAVHYLSNFGSVFPGRHSVLTVHDLFDRRRTRDRIAARLLAACVQRAQRVVTPSLRTRLEVEAAFPSLAGAVTVIPHGMRRLPLPAAPRQHVLAFGGAADPRKRTDLMIEAYAAYRASAADPLPLVVLARAGLTHNQRTRLLAVDARIVDDATADEVDALMGAAAALLYPTSMEGFGLPVVEAAEHATPVLVAASADLPDEVIGAHCFRVPSTSPADWAEGLQEAIARGPVPDALDLPDWATVAGRYAALYEEVAR